MGRNRRRRRGRREGGQYEKEQGAASEHSPFGVFKANMPKLPPPEHGIRVGEIGTTWWGARWVEALLQSGAVYAARLHRGRTYAQQGRVHDLAVANGIVTALVTGSRAEPYRVKLALRPLQDQTWHQAIRAMATKASFNAALLAGEMPRAIDQAFSSARASLFPSRRGDLKAACSCPDDANPCKHIAALHLVLAEAFDRDPFLMFELRGRSRASVLDALRSLRAGTTPAMHRPARGVPPAPRAARPGRAGVRFDDAAREGYDRLRGPVTDLRFRISAATAKGALLQQLGTPSGWRLDTPFADLVRPAATRAAARARDIALGGGTDTAAPNGSLIPRRSGRSGAAGPPLDPPTAPSPAAPRKTPKRSDSTPARPRRGNVPLSSGAEEAHERRAEEGTEE
jgi:uncharacterized Zn finger protein